MSKDTESKENVPVKKHRVPAGQSTGGLLGTSSSKRMPKTGNYSSGKAKIFSPSNRGI